MKYELTRRQELLQRAWKPCFIFLDSWSEANTIGQKRRLLKQYYKELFNQDLPKDVPLLWVHAKIGYRLQYLGFIEFGLEEELSKKFIQNYKAMQEFDITKVTKDTKILLKEYDNFT